MLKNLSLIALLGFAVVGVPNELSAKSVKVAGTQKGAAAKSVTRQVAQQNVTIEFYSPSIVRILKSDAGLGAPVQKKSYSVVLKPQQTKDIQIEENGEIANIKSSHISVELNQQTGEIRFLSRDGKLLLTDTKTRLEARKDEANKGKWTHVLYRQSGQQGKLFIGGKKAVQAAGMPVLSKVFTAMPAYSWIGRAPFTTDSYQSKTA